MLVPEAKDAYIKVAQDCIMQQCQATCQVEQRPPTTASTVISWEQVAEFGTLPGPMMVGAEHAWGEPSAGLFKVRGIDYFDDKKKVASGESLYRLMAVDFEEGPVGTDFSNASTTMASPARRFQALHDSMEGPNAPAFVFVINFLFKFSSDKVGHMCFYFVRRDDKIDDPASRLDEYLVSEALDNPAGEKRRTGCFKVIPAVREGPWLVKKALGSEKPAIIAKKIKPGIFRGVRMLELVFDTTTSTAGNSVIGSIKGPLKGLVIDLAFVWEGKIKEYLPERILGAVRMSHLDATRMAQARSSDPEDGAPAS